MADIRDEMEETTAEETTQETEATENMTDFAMGRKFDIVLDIVKVNTPLTIGGEV